MKKINMIFIITTICLAFMTIITELDKGIVVILKDSSIALTLLVPYIVRKVFKIDIDESLVFVWIIFIFLAHYLGVICQFYYKFEFFDKVAHTFSGVLSGYVAVMVLDKVKIKSMLFKIIFILSFSAMVAFLWEVFEFTCNALFGGDAQMVAKTGVTDTMGDMIVAYIGAIFVSFFYYLKEKM